MSIAYTSFIFLAYFIIHSLFYYLLSSVLSKIFELSSPSSYNFPHFVRLRRIVTSNGACGPERVVGIRVIIFRVIIIGTVIEHTARLRGYLDLRIIALLRVLFDRSPPLNNESQIGYVAVFLSVNDSVNLLQRHPFGLYPIPPHQANDNDVPRAINHVCFPSDGDEREGERKHRPKPANETVIVVAGVQLGVLTQWHSGRTGRRPYHSRGCCSS